MLRNYLLTITRHLTRHRSFSAVNILGLGLGMGCFVFISLYVWRESGFDTFHADYDSIYRVNKTVATDDGTTEEHVLTAGLLAAALESTFPEVEDAVRILPWFDPMTLIAGEQVAVSPDVVIADSNFFTLFSFPLLQGDPAEVLRAPLSMVLTDRTASRLFPGEDPVGKTVRALGNLDYTITGVAADTPEESHIQFEAVISWASSEPGGLDFSWMNRWITQAPITYVRLAGVADADALEGKLPEFYRQNDPERAERYTLWLQPLEDVYLGSAGLLYTGRLLIGNAAYVNALRIVSALILLIACINFVNLSTARISRRAREVGVRKSLGAVRSQLVGQFIGESMMHAALALVFGILLLQVAFPAFESLSGITLRPDSWFSTHAARTAVRHCSRNRSRIRAVAGADALACPFCRVVEGDIGRARQRPAPQYPGYTPVCHLDGTCGRCAGRVSTDAVHAGPEPGFLGRADSGPEYG